MVFQRSILFFAGLIFCLQSQSQTTVKLTETVTLNFPGQPEVIDTLGQKVFHYDSEGAYFACIVQQTKINPSTRASMDINKFYTDVYQSLNKPQDHCQTVKQQEIHLQDLVGMEFYYKCDPNPEIPEIRYKRLILYESRLFVLDYWTTQANFPESSSEKNAFFESMLVKSVDNTAPIPSAFESRKTSNSFSYYWLLLILLLFPAVYFFWKRKPKK